MTKATAQLAHTAQPAIIIGSLSFPVFLDFLMGKNQEFFSRKSLHNFFRHLLGRQYAVDSGGSTITVSSFTDHAGSDGLGAQY